MSLRIYNKQIEDDKTVIYGLTKIFGIGLATSTKLCLKLGIPLHLKIRELRKNHISELTQWFKKNNNFLEKNLQQNIKNNIKKYVNNKSYKGLRHKYHLPVRGQRTCSNAKTRTRFYNKSKK